MGYNNTNESHRRDQLPRALVAIGLRFPKTIIVTWLIVALLAATEITKLRIETSTDSVLDQSGPSWAFYQESQDRFGGDEIITILIEGERAFDRNALNEIIRLTNLLENLPGVWRVDSLATVPLIRLTKSGDLSLNAALSEGVPISQEDLRRLSDEIRSDPIARKTLISEDGRYFAVNIVLEKGAEDHYLPILGVVEDEIDGQRAWLSGVPIFRVETDSWTRRELLTFVPITLFVVGLLCFLLVLDVRLAFIPLFSSGIGSVVVLGAMAVNETPLTISTVILPSVLLALGCAYAMHFLMLVSPGDRGSEFAERLRGVSLPIALSGLTTALGFLAIGFVKIQAIRDVGVFGALGVLIVLVATLTAVPAAVRLFPSAGSNAAVRRFMSEAVGRRVIDFVLGRRRVIIAFWLVLMGIISIGIFRLKIETDVIRWFPKRHAIRISYEVIRNRLSGISPMNVVIDSPSSGLISSGDVLVALDGLTSYLESLDEVGRALSVADLLVQMNGILTDEGRGKVPTSDDQIEQYLLLLESNEYTRDLITDDRRSGNVLLRVDENSSDVLLQVARKAERWWAEHGVRGYSAQTTGVMHEFARSEQAIAFGQIRGLMFVLITVGAILIAAFRRVRIAGGTLAANAIPIVIAFGSMGLCGVRIDAGTVVVGSIAFGIAVDDTIHAVTEFSKLIERGISKREALLASYLRVFPAVVFTTVIVATGFLVLGLSRFALIRNLGVVTSGVLVLCLLADVLLLPALLYSAKGKSPRGGSLLW